MENKDIVIIALIVLAIYLYYQQNKPNLLGNSEEKIQELQNQVNHYQTLYQKRVEKDSIGSEVKEFQQLQTEFSEFKKNTEQLENNWKTEKQELEKVNLDKEQQLTQIHQEQLRQINLLFDENAEHYQNIDFNGLYSLLSSIAERERERERERAKVNNDDKDSEIKPVFSKHRKKKK